MRQLLASYSSLWPLFGVADANEMLTRIVPRYSQTTINLPKPFLIYGLGNATNEDLAEDTDHVAFRQFFEVWVHDEGGDFDLIDDIVFEVKKALTGENDPDSMLTHIRWLETSGEFHNDTYNTNFRYIRFQGIISKGAAA